MATNAATRYTSWAEYYSDPANDPYNGDYEMPFEAYKIQTGDDGTEPEAVRTTLATLLNLDGSSPGTAFIRFEQQMEEDEPLLQVIHNPRTMSQPFGTPALPYHGRPLIQVGDNIDGHYTTCYWPEEGLEVTSPGLVSTHRRG